MPFTLREDSRPHLPIFKSLDIRVDIINLNTEEGCSRLGGIILATCDFHLQVNCSSLAVRGCDTRNKRRVHLKELNGCGE